MPTVPVGYERVKVVASFQELVSTPFAGGINALCWPRALPGDFAEVVRALAVPEGIERLDPARLRGLSLSAAGRDAVEVLLADLALLQEHGCAPELNALVAYPRAEPDELLSTDVYSFHADSAPVPSETWLCTYHGPASDGLPNEQARRQVDDLIVRATLLEAYGGCDDDEFAEWLRENCFDLHYAPLPAAQPFSFGLHNLWRIAVEHPGSAVPPCLHRAPNDRPGETRLLLIS